MFGTWKLKLYGIITLLLAALGGVLYKSGKQSGTDKERLDAIKEDHENATEIDQRVGLARRDGVRPNRDTGYRD